MTKQPKRTKHQTEPAATDTAGAPAQRGPKRSEPAATPAGSTMPPSAFAAWRRRHGLTQRAAAIAVGRTERAVQMWEAGSSPIEFSVLLSTAYHDEHPDQLRRFLDAMKDRKIGDYADLPVYEFKIERD